MFEEWSQEEFDSHSYDEMIQILKDNGMLFERYRKAQCKGFESHHIIPKYVQIQEQGKVYDDSCVRVSSFDHIALHLKGAFEFGGDWIFSLMGISYYNEINDIKFINIKDVSNFRDIAHKKQGKIMHSYIWITDGSKRKRWGKDKEIPIGWSKCGPTKGLKFITNGIENKEIPKISEIPVGWRVGRVGNTIKGKIRITNGIENKVIDKSTDIPKGWKVGVKEENKIVYINNGEITKIWSKEEQIPTGWKIGRLNPTTKNKIGITDGTNYKFIDINDEIPNGWWKGVTDSCKEKHASYYRGKIWITDGNKNKAIDKNEEIPNGWRKGLTRNKTK